MIAACYGPYVFGLEDFPVPEALASGAPFVIETRQSPNRHLSVQVLGQNPPELGELSLARWEDRGLFIQGRGARGQVTLESAEFAVAPWLLGDSSGVSYIVACCGLSWALLDGGLAMHASGVVTSRGAELFSGHSGIGKSTTAHRISPPYPLFTEDQVLDSLRAERARATAKPVHRIALRDQEFCEV